jgi:NADPH-dependent 2,4-dienoyl-CoA reductase/sulfur reductase-like enzyme
LQIGRQAGAQALPKRGAALLGSFQHHQAQGRIELLAGVSAWGLFPGKRLAIASSNGSQLLEAEHLLLCPGAYEYVPPFPGWTLPGVMTPGGAQALAKAMHVLPGRRALVAGTGPFLLVVADQLHRAGMDVAGVVEMASSGETLRAVPGLLADLGLFLKGLYYLYRLWRAGIPVYRGHVLVEAKGDEEVQEAVIAPCDKEGYPDLSRTRSVQVDTICAGYGFLPRTQLAQLAGCALHYDQEQESWIPERDEELQTSVAGVWVAGDGGGVGGALAAEVEGTLAGLAVASRLGALESRAYARLKPGLQRRLAKLQRFGAALGRLYRLRPGLTRLAKADTLVCRCEELTRAEVKTGIDAGGTDLRTLKVMTRLGMGPCQGLMCWPAMARFIAAETGRPMQEVGHLSVRPPITPVDLGSLCEIGVSGRAGSVSGGTPEGGQP